MTLRPYQLLCAICSPGEAESGTTGGKISEILAAVRKTPDMPVTLCCNAGDVFAYQDPGPAEDTPGGPEFNIRRDLEILHKLNLFPGCTLPARILFHRVLDTIDDISGICGCSKGDNDAYKKGRALGIGALIPDRTEQEMKREKAESLAALYKAEAVPIRPHILLCAVCQYGGGTRPPFAEDNLPELIALILKQPDILLRMAPYADWMMCAPCPYRAPGLNACVNNKGSGGLPNQLRDLRLLQRLGLAYGSTMKARDLYRLIFERIPGTLAFCRIEHSRPSVWWTGCGAATADSENFAKGKKMLMTAMGL